jgi:hypothetical protein
MLLLESSDFSTFSILPLQLPLYVTSIINVNQKTADQDCKHRASLYSVAKLFFCKYKMGRAELQDL